MTTLVERLRSHDAPTVWNVSDEAADLIEEQQKRIAELEERLIKALGLLNAESQVEAELNLGDLKQQLTTAQAQIKVLESDPAIHFAHRFAVVLECMLLADTSSSVWDEATTLLSEYSDAQDKWREMMGEPYVSGFGKD